MRMDRQKNESLGEYAYLFVNVDLDGGCAILFINRLVLVRAERDLTRAAGSPLCEVQPKQGRFLKTATSNDSFAPRVPRHCAGAKGDDREKMLRKGESRSRSYRWGQRKHEEA